MKICVFGAGAVGGFLGARLANAGADVSLIARGDHLRRIKDEGLTILGRDEPLVVRPQCTDNPGEAGPHDVVFVALKTAAAPAAARLMKPLLGPKTTVVTAMNGLPWWYFHNHPGGYSDWRLASVDPGNQQWDSIGPERAVGCVVYVASEIVAPGIIRHTYGNRFVLGEPNGEVSERCRAIARVIQQSSLKAPIRRNIRQEIWIKLWGNLAFNPISVLTGATLEDMVRDRGVRDVAHTMMLEGKAVAGQLGIVFPISLEERIDATERVGAHKTSMLQDLERKKPLEIDALLGVVSELGKKLGIATPMVDAVYALTRRRAIESGCPNSDSTFGSGT